MIFLCRRFILVCPLAYEHTLFFFKEADIPSILNCLSDANWVDIFGTSDPNTCVSFFYEKLEKSFEILVPVFRSPARPMTHPWYTRELVNLENRKAREIVNLMKEYAPIISIYIVSAIHLAWMASKTVL
jgi:hypothetical protein